MGGKSKKKKIEPGSVAEVPFKVAILGSALCGKTTMIKKVLFNEDVLEYQPTMSDLHAKRIEIDKVPYHFVFQDASGLEESFRNTIISNTNLIIMVCSLIQPSTLKEVEDILAYSTKCIEQEKQSGYSARPKKVLYLLANKKDLTNDRKIPPEDLKALADKFCKCELEIRETSALLGEGLEAFTEALEELIKRHREWMKIHMPKGSKCVIC